MRQFKRKFRARMCVGSNMCVVCVVVCVCVYYSLGQKCERVCMFMFVHECFYVHIHAYIYAPVCL